jgi:hypothetical protein
VKDPERKDCPALGRQAFDCLTQQSLAASGVGARQWRQSLADQARRTKL